MIKRIVTLYFNEEAVEEIKEVLAAKVADIRAVPGCQHLEIFQDTVEPSIMFSYSFWSSQEHLDAYRASSLFGEVWPFLKSHFRSAPRANSVNVLHYLD